MNSKEPLALLKSLIALVLIGLCIIAANWQYQRGVVRHEKNYQIQENSKLPPVKLEDLLREGSLSSLEWRSVELTGSFDKSHEVLLRNRYNADGKYGFEYLTLFNSGDLRFWIDRGWVKAGESALARPEIPETPLEEISLIGRIRINDSLPRGSFFALPAKGNLISDWDLKSKVETSDFYIDLISGPGVTPLTPAELPELSDGPHMAYALQWLFFAALVLYGRYLIRKG